VDINLPVKKWQRNMPASAAEIYFVDKNSLHITRVSLKQSPAYVAIAEQLLHEIESGELKTRLGAVACVIVCVRALRLLLCVERGEDECWGLSFRIRG
jgi:hypothetical protein